MSRRASGTAVLRVAIVGLGPKGLFALERLLAHASRQADTGISIDTFDPHPAPGAGPHYDPGQPEYLRMNFAAEQIDMWPAAEPAAPLSPRPSFVQWRSGLEPGGTTEAYPPRALVGRYLADGLERLLAASPAGLVEHHALAVTQIRPQGNRWELSERPSEPYDEVLVAIGHAPGSDMALASGSWPHAARLIAGVFPVDRQLPPAQLPAGATVAVRGFALTMIDAALALTEGRGGSFEPLGAGPRLQYVPGREDVEALVPYSRSGRPMLAKPSPADFDHAGLEPIATASRARIAALQTGTVLEGLIAIVARTAAASLRVLAPDLEDSSAELRHRLETAAAGSAPEEDLEPAAALERSLAIAVGAGAPGLDWALGHAWRSCYPAIVDRLGANGLDGADWPAFRRLAAEMERVAFGPPPLNVAKLLALAEAGKVDLTHTRGWLEDVDGRTEVRSAAGGRAVDAVIDAVLPSPGVLGVHHPMLDGLTAAGLARVAPGRRGLELTANVTCVGADGKPSGGLGAIGRPTEDWVIGNDTLNRELHPEADRWARRVVARAVRR